MKTNKEVALAFLNNYPDDAYAGNLRYFAKAGKLFSYSTIIAQRFDNGTIIFNATKYSPTTSKHQSLLFRCGLCVYAEATNIPRGASNLTTEDITTHYSPLNES